MLSTAVVVSKAPSPTKPCSQKKRRGVEFGDACLVHYEVGDYPQRDEQQNERNKNRLPDEITDTFKYPLRGGDFFLLARVERQHGLDVLADLIALGINGSVSGAGDIRLRRRSRFGFHQDILRDTLEVPA